MIVGAFGNLVDLSGVLDVLGSRPRSPRRSLSSSTSSGKSGSSSSCSAGAASGGLRQQRLGLVDRHHLLAAVDGEADLAADLLVGIDGEGDLEALLEPAQMRALVVEHIERDLGPRADDQIVGRRP